MIASATAADLDAIDEIERHSFPQPWPRVAFETQLAGPASHARLIVERAGAAITGFCNYWLVVDELHVLAIATHPDRRRSGTGARLLAAAIAEARSIRCTRATLEVRRGNAPAIALYQRAGFRTVHVRSRYYQDNGEDALIMICELTPPSR